MWGPGRIRRRSAGRARARDTRSRPGRGALLLALVGGLTSAAQAAAPAHDGQVGQIWPGRDCRAATRNQTEMSMIIG